MFLTSSQQEVDKQIAFLGENGSGAFSNICADVLEKDAPPQNNWRQNVNLLSTL